MTYRTIHLSLVLLLASVAAACTTPNPNYRRPMADAMPELRCPDETTCEAPTGVCKLDTGQCVQCTPENQAACTGTTPICGEDFACRGCIAHSDCASTSNVCLPDGSCAAESEVAYVGPGGSGTTCSKAQPCASLQVGVSTKRPYVKVTGTLAGPTTIKDTNVTVLADPGARLSDAGRILTVEGKSNVVIYDIEFTGRGFAVYMPFNTGADAATVSIFRCALSNAAISGGGPGSTINISQSRIYNSKESDCAISTYGDLNIVQSSVSDNSNGVCSPDGKVHIVDSTISNNDGTGIKVDNGQLTVHRSSVAGNRILGIGAFNVTANVSQSTISNNGYGLSAGGQVNISNNFFVHNGPGSINLGAVVISHRFGSSSFQFNTVADNQALGTNAQTGGVHCRGDFAGSHNLVIRNTGGQANPQTSGTCAFVNSLFEASNPGFADPSKNDYHLTANTGPELLDKIDCSGIKDIDGEDRPKNGRCDYGADEY